MIGIQVGGAWLHQIAPVGDLKWSTCYGNGEGGGSLAASWSMALPKGFTHPSLRQGSGVSIVAGGLPIWQGVLSEPDRGDWTFQADGYCRRAEAFAAVDASGVPSTDVSVVIPAAISRGLGWVDPGGLSVGSVSADSEDASNLNTVGAVLDRYCQNAGKNWRIDNARRLIIESNPSEVAWSLKPGVPAMSIADDDYATTLFGRYVASVAGTPPEPATWGAASVSDSAAANRWGAREQIEDLTDLGTMDATSAQALLQARLNAGKARPAFAQGVEVGFGQIATLGGVPAYLPFVQAGQWVRHRGALDSESLLAFGVELTWLIGGTEYEANSRTISLTPVGLAPRTLSSVIAAQQKAAQDAAQGATL